MNKYFLIVGLMVVAGCSNETAVKSDSVKWVSVGTLVRVGPGTEPTRRPGRVESAIFGETTLIRSRVETTEGVYLVDDKIAIAETGAPVKVGYEPSDKYPEAPSYLTFRGKHYKIVR
jgi:hypothetical protein